MGAKLTGRIWPCVDGPPLASGFLILVRSAGWCGHVFGTFVILMAAEVFIGRDFSASTLGLNAV